MNVYRLLFFVSELPIKYPDKHHKEILVRFWKLPDDYFQFETVHTDGLQTVMYFTGFSLLSLSQLPV